MNAFDLREPVSAWTHFVGLLLALPGTLLLWRRGGGDPGKRLSLLVFGLSLVFCYAASTLYHGVRIPADRLAVFDRLDRIGIFALIAGSYTPLAWSLMRGRWRWGTLAAVWVMAAVASGCGDRRPLPAAGDDRPVPGDGVGRRRLLCPDGAGRVAPCLACPSSPVACSTAWGRCSTCSAGPPSGRGSSGPTTCSTCSCWRAAWPTTGSSSRSSCRSAGGAVRSSRAGHPVRRCSIHHVFLSEPRQRLIRSDHVQQPSSTHGTIARSSGFHGQPDVPDFLDEGGVVGELERLGALRFSANAHQMRLPIDRDGPADSAMLQALLWVPFICSAE